MDRRIVRAGPARRLAGPARRLAATTFLLGLGLLACAGTATTEPAPTSEPAPASELVRTPELTPVGPPAAIASVEGGEPVTAQLGTYTWAATGSDSPWLRGAPIRVGAGEVLSVVFDPPIEVESWAARYVPRDQDGPDGAIALGQGPPPSSFAVPPPGTWTVELAVVFTDGQGSVSYAWSVAVE